MSTLRWLAAGAAGLWAYGRYAEAKRARVPLDRAFKLENLGKSVLELEREDFAAREAVALRLWGQHFPGQPFPGLIPAVRALETKLNGGR